jgi:sigma-B regulation protein RsbU (phosphoserine phosphatase)
MQTPTHPASQTVPRAILELIKAQSLQQHLLACTRPATGAGRSLGYDVGLHFQPDDWVGGDYVDIVPLSDGRVFFGLADVCGKGMSSAMIATAIWSSVRCLLADGTDVGGLMNRLNSHLCQMLPPASFVTMFAATLDPATGEMWYVNAGHPPAWLLSADARPRLFGADGDIPLGIEPGEVTEQYAKLDPGDLLALYTDGCFDRAGKDGALLEPADLADILQDLGGDPNVQLQTVADVLADQLAEMEARASGDSMIHDDTTLLLIRFTGAARPIDPRPVRPRGVRCVGNRQSLERAKVAQ